MRPRGLGTENEWRHRGTIYLLVFGNEWSFVTTSNCFSSVIHAKMRRKCVMGLKLSNSDLVIRMGNLPTKTIKSVLRVARSKMRSEERGFTLGFHQNFQTAHKPVV